MKPITRHLLRFVFLGGGAVCLAASPGPDVKEIVGRSVTNMEANWKAAPNYTYVERDTTSKHGGSKTAKTYQVLMIEGSQYNRLIALNGRPLSPQEAGREARKLKAEIERRKRETPDERNRRVAKYQKERHQDHVMMHEMVNAFDFKLVGDAKLDGRDVWVLDANPKPGYQPINQEAKVLTGMKGRLWIDKEQSQWVKVEAEVIHPVSMFVIAKVSPGTRFVLEQEPVSGDVWLPRRFTQDVNASVFGFWNENSTEDDLYRDYKPMPSETQLLAIASQAISQP